MPSFNEILNKVRPELQRGNFNFLHQLRKDYLKQLSAKTQRNTIAYYSNWMKINSSDVAINDKDKNAFMANVHGLDKNLGLDLILHTPGGDLAATESIVDYLYNIFGTNIRAIIPQIAMSAGTMIALSCNEIVMGKHSNLGPIDPQLRGVPCESVLDEFKTAKDEIKSAPWSAPLWQSIIGKYHPTFLVECKHAVDWSKSLALEWLTRNMCGGDNEKAKKVLAEFGDHEMHKSHSRHISLKQCIEKGLSVIELEKDPVLQDLVLSIHHCYQITLDSLPMAKVVENNNGTTYALNAPMQQGAMQNGPAHKQPLVKPFS